MEQETIEELKKAMGYIDQTECCASCEKYLPRVDGSFMIGGTQPEPRGERCNLNVIEVPVDSAGRCNYFKKRKPLVTLVR